MAMSRRETEIKLAFPSPEVARRTLDALGARQMQSRVYEDNVLYDLDHAPLTGSGRLLRLRRAGPVATLTFKGPVESGRRHKVRPEHEVRVEDAEKLVRILEGVGFAPVYRYQKYRTCFEHGGVDIALDETALGTFVELEGEPDAIDRVAAELGKGPKDYLLESYRELQEKAAEEQGLPLGDLLFPEDRR